MQNSKFVARHVAKFSGYQVELSRYIGLASTESGRGSLRSPQLLGKQFLQLIFSCGLFKSGSGSLNPSQAGITSSIKVNLYQFPCTYIHAMGELFRNEIAGSTIFVERLR